MPTPTKGPRLGGSPSHERMILANLARSLFAEGRIRTTEAKAKRLRPQAERLITFAKRGDVAARRQVLTVVRDKAVVHKLFAEIAPRFADRPGGYTRILKLGPRPGDAAPMVVIELVEQGEAVQRTDEDEAATEGGRRRRFGRGRSAARGEDAPEGSNRAARRAAARRRGGAAAEGAEGAEGAEAEGAAAEREDEDLAPNVPTDAEIEAGATPLEAQEEDEADLDEADEADESDEVGEDAASDQAEAGGERGTEADGGAKGEK